MTEDELSPEEEREQRLRDRLSSVQSSIGQLTGRLSFSDELRAVTDAHSSLRDLSSRLASGRARGFVYQSELEYVLQDAGTKAEEALNTTRSEAERAASALRSRVEELHGRAFSPRLTRGVPDEGQIDWLDQQYSSLDSAMDEASARIKELARPFTELIEEAEQGIKRMTFTLDLFGDASFQQAPDEAPLVALKAKYRDAPGGEKEGVLFLSNQRIRFEGREEKVLERKFLVFASKTEIIKTLFIDEVIGHVASTEASQEGVVFKDEILTIRWGRGGKAAIELLEGESAEAWSTVIGYIISGEIEQTRIASASPNQAPLTFPEHCANCGAPLPAPVKGQQTLACSYCKREHAGVRA